MVNQQQLQRLYRYCVMLTADPVTAEDLLQSSFENWMARGQGRTYSQAYMRTVIRNQFIDNCRRDNKIAFEPLEDGVPYLLDESCLAELHLQHDLIEYVVTQLNVADREVLFLWAVDGYSSTEIAVELNQPRGTILSRLHRIKQKVAELQLDVAIGG